MAFEAALSSETEAAQGSHFEGPGSREPKNLIRTSLEKVRVGVVARQEGPQGCGLKESHKHVRAKVAGKIPFPGPEASAAIGVACRHRQLCTLP